MRILGMRGKTTIDQEGEAKLVFIISKVEAEKITAIPTETLLQLDISIADNEVIGRVE